MPGGISTVTNRVEYQGSGSGVVFAFQFPLNAQSDLSVFAYNSSATSPGVITPMTLNGGGPTGYSLSGNTDPSGVYPNGLNVIVNSAPNAQTVMVLFRSSALTNTFVIGQFGNIPSSGLNNEINYLTMIAQRHQDQITRSVRLPDGLAGLFDMALPQNIKSRPGKFIVTNSNANGWDLSDALAGSYIPNTVIVATGTSAIASLGGAPAGQVMVSGGSSAPTWAAISFGSGNVPSSAITGTLSTLQGGTGTGDTYLQYGVFFGSSTTQMANTAAGGGDQPLLGNAGAAPSFRPLPLTSGSSVIGTLPTAFGGTGAAGPYTQFGLVYSPTATTFGSVPSALVGTVLTANGSSAPTFQALPAANLTTGSGILPIASGGTNRGTMTAGALLFGSSATQVGLGVVGINQVVLGGGSSAPLTVVGYGSSAHVLISAGAGAPPAWGPNTAAVSNTVSTVNAAYVQQGADSMIIANSSNYTISLVAAATGKELTILKPAQFNSSAVSAVTIAGSGTITIAGTSSIQLVGAGDYMRLFYDGNNYQLSSDRITSRSLLNRTGGFGTADTRVRAFGSVAFTEGNCHRIIAGSATTTGALLSIDVPGRYAITYSDAMSVADIMGLVLNGSGLTTTGLAAIVPHRKVLAITQNVTDQAAAVSWSGYLNAGDTVRPMTNGGIGSAGGPNTYGIFSVERL